MNFFSEIWDNLSFLVCLFVFFKITPAATVMNWTRTTWPVYSTTGKIRPLTQALDRQAGWMMGCPAGMSRWPRPHHPRQWTSRRTSPSVRRQDKTVARKYFGAPSWYLILFLVSPPDAPAKVAKPSVGSKKSPIPKRRQAPRKAREKKVIR